MQRLFIYIYLDWSNKIRKYQIETGLFEPHVLSVDRKKNWWQRCDWGKDIIYELETEQTVTFKVGNGYRIKDRYIPFAFAFYLRLDASEQAAQLIKDKCFVLIISIEKEQNLSSIMTGDKSSLLMNPFIYEGPIMGLLKKQQIFHVQDENGNDITNEYWYQKLQPLLITGGILSAYSHFEYIQIYTQIYI